MGNGYSCDGMIKLCTNDNLNKVALNSAYMCDLNSLSMWHNRLGHIGLNTIKRIVKCGMIVFMIFRKRTGRTSNAVD